MELRPDLPAWVEAAILKALAKRPEDRFESAEEMAAALSGPGALGSEKASASTAGSIEPGLRSAQAEPVPLEKTRVRKAEAPPGGCSGGIGQAAVLVTLLLGALLLLLSRPEPVREPNPTGTPASPRTTPVPLPPPVTVPVETAPTPSPPPPLPETRLLEVPDLGMVPVDTATIRLGQTGLRLGGVNQVPDSGQPAGLVLGQNPRAGTMVPEGTAVELQVSQ
ncbi:MAG: PASTA domain-containing protein [Armatimonadetes bacterium]|nr:PASTA domain-containing protein [Armatimonadota bacterium]